MLEGLRVLVCGGRNFNDYAYLKCVLDALHDDRRFGLVIHGDARGADRLSEAWAFSRSLPVCAFRANWKWGAAAGPIRNQAMLAWGNPELVVAFPGGNGTADMVRRAEVAGVEVRVAGVSSKN